MDHGVGWGGVGGSEHQALSEWERRRGEGGREGGERKGVFAPPRANDGTLSLTSAAADRRRGPSAFACLVFFSSRPPHPPVLACSPPPQAGQANWLSDGAGCYTAG